MGKKDWGFMEERMENNPALKDVYKEMEKALKPHFDYALKRKSSYEDDDRDKN